MKIILSFLLASIFMIPKSDWSWKKLPVSFEENFRGLCVVNDKIIWASGTNGLVIKSTDGGNTWEEHRIKGADSLDFRGIYAWDENSAIIMSSGTPARIYKTIDGGCDWSLVWEDTRPEYFLDAMTFSDEKNGWILGDPINGKWLVLHTTDGGKSWNTLAEKNLPSASDGEAAFAASGTNIQWMDGHLFFISGGAYSKLYHTANEGNTWDSYFLPMSGGKSKGAFSFIMTSPESGIVVGGDYEKPEEEYENCYVTKDGGKKWIAVKALSPKGYRSCIAERGNKLFVTVGTNGSDISENGGLVWENISRQGFNSCGCGKKECFAIGKGIIAKLQKD